MDKIYLCNTQRGTIIFFYPDKLKKLLGSILKFFIPLLCGAALFGICTVIWTCTRSESFYNLKLITFGSALSMIIGLMSHIFRALRWKLQLKTLGVDPSVKALTNAVFGMYAMNLLIPRVGKCGVVLIWRVGKKCLLRRFWGLLYPNVCAIR